MRKRDSGMESKTRRVLDKEMIENELIMSVMMREMGLVLCRQGFLIWSSSRRCIRAQGRDRSKTGRRSFPSYLKHETERGPILSLDQVKGERFE